MTIFEALLFGKVVKQSEDVYERAIYSREHFCDYRDEFYYLKSIV